MLGIATSSTTVGGPLLEAYDGPQNVGMDLHRRLSVLIRMTEDGRKLATARITNGPARLAAEIRRAGPHPKVLLEAYYGWDRAADALAAAGAEVHVAHPPEGEGLHPPPGQERRARRPRSGRPAADGRLPEA